jgi:probable rRNA maturation factor
MKSMRKNRVLVKKRVRGVESKLLSKIAHRALEVLGLSKVELSIALVSDAQIKRLNKLYRNKDKPTDVLSFPIGEKVERLAYSWGHRYLGGYRQKAGTGAWPQPWRKS